MCYRMIWVKGLEMTKGKYPATQQGDFRVRLLVSETWLETITNRMDLIMIEYKLSLSVAKTRTFSVRCYAKDYTALRSGLGLQQY